MLRRLQREVFDAGGERVVAVCETAEGGGETAALCVLRAADGAVLVAEAAGGAGAAWRRARQWPLAELRAVEAPADSDVLSLETVSAETHSWVCANAASRAEWLRALRAAGGGAGAAGADLEERELAALLEDAAPPGDDADRWVRGLAERLDALDELNLRGMLAAEEGSARLLARLGAAGALCAGLEARLARYEEAARGGAAPDRARSGAALADHNARLLLRQLRELFEWLDAPALADAEDPPEAALAGAEGRARVLAGAEALRAALEPRGRPAWALRLAGVRARLRHLAKCRERLAAALARHLNNTLIHLANEAAQAPPGPAPRPRRHHAELAPYAPFVAWIKACEEKTYDALVKVYTGGWARVYEREVRALCEAARAAAAPATAPAPPPLDAQLDAIMTYVEVTCDAEQDFCTKFFNLDAETKSETGSEGSGEGAEARRGGGAEARRVLADVFPALEADLLALLAHVDKQDPYGAMRVLACVGGRVVSEGGRRSHGALAAAAVAAKRQADRQVQARLAALPDAVRAAARRPRAGVLPFLDEFEEFCAACERIFSRGGRRADVERWYCALADGILRAVQHAEHPRTPRAVVQMENYHRLHAALSALRLPALDAVRREAKRRYGDALRAYVTQYFGRPLEKLNQFFEGVAEATARGVREEEVCYQAAFSKQALRKVLAQYPAAEVTRALHRLYRTVEKHLGEEQGLLQVVWRAMQEEFMAQHKALEARVQACYAGAGLALPLSAADILDAFSDIARRH